MSSWRNPERVAPGFGCLVARWSASHRRRRANERLLAVLVSGVMVLTACTAEAEPEPTTNPPSVSSVRPADSLNTVATTRSSSAASEPPLLDGCDQARPITSAFPTPSDMVIGPLSYAGFRGGATDPIAEPNWNGGYFYKTGAQLRPGRSVTVSIGDEAADYAAIVTENGPERGVHAVTYQSCSTPGSLGFWWVGGFVLWNRQTACVPIEITTPADTMVRRTEVSLGAATC